MEMYLTYHKVLDKLQEFQENYCCLNSFGYGNLVEFGKNVSGETINYPYLYIVPQAVTYDQNTTTYQVSAIFADRLNENLDNEKDAVSDMSLAARQLLSEIWRGNLQGVFDCLMPVNAQPFMERFNDYVAGVALDLSLIVYEDMNACQQWATSPTPTPSVTPTLTPTLTVTPSMTPTLTPGLSPSATPTLTPTPSSTPANPDPSTLGALWWIDFTNSSTLNIGCGCVSGATDLISSVYFEVEDGNACNAPVYNSTGYLGVSGTTQENAQPITNQPSTYTTDLTGFTWFTFMYDDNVSQVGGTIMEAWDNGWNTGTRLFRYQGDVSGPVPEKWRASVRLQTGAELNLTTDITYSAWTLVAVRCWEQGGQVYLETWNDNVLSGSTSAAGTIRTFSDVEYGLMFGGGIDYNTEQFFFDYKLSDSELTQMFNYIANKY